MADDDWSLLADDFLGYQQQQAHHAIGLDELAADLLADLAPRAEHHEDHADEPWAEQPMPGLGQVGQPFDLTLTYGPPEVVRYLGNNFQKQLMNRVFTEFSRRNRPQQRQKRGPQDKTHTTIMDYFVLSTKTVSVAAVAAFSGVGEKAVKRGLGSTAAFTLHGGTWLVGAMLSCWRRVFQSRVARPVLFLQRLKYDETPLRLKVSEYNEIFNRAADSVISKISKPSHQEEYRFAKIFRIVFNLGDLTKFKL